MSLNSRQLLLHRNVTRMEMCLLLDYPSPPRQLHTDISSKCDKLIKVHIFLLQLFRLFSNKLMFLLLCCGVVFVIHPPLWLRFGEPPRRYLKVSTYFQNGVDSGRSARSASNQFLLLHMMLHPRGSHVFQSLTMRFFANV